MKCLKCDGELEITQTDMSINYAEVRFVCNADSDHRFYGFVDKADIIADDA